MQHIYPKAVSVLDDPFLLIKMMPLFSLEGKVTFGNKIGLLCCIVPRKKLVELPWAQGDNDVA